MQAIVAVSQSWGIGKGGHLLFRISADLQRFKALTTGHAVIMGRKTLQSLPGGRGLPNRRNLVLTRQANFSPDRAETVHSLKELLTLADSDAFVIGGFLPEPGCGPPLAAHLLQRNSGGKRSEISICGVQTSLKNRSRYGSDFLL